MQKKSSLAEIYFFQLISTTMLGHNPKLNWKNINTEVDRNHFLNILLQLSTNLHRVQVKKSPKIKKYKVFKKFVRLFNISSRKEKRNLELSLKAVLVHLSCLGIGFNQKHTVQPSQEAHLPGSIPMQTQPITKS